MQADSSEPTPEQRAAFWQGVKDGKHAVEAAKAAEAISSPASHADHTNSPSKDSPAAETPTASTQEPGNMPSVAPAVSSGPGKPPLMAFGVPLARGANGKLYNPAKGEPAPKAQHVALLKPDSVRTYDELGAESLAPKGGISGLDLIPKGWPVLPSSVSLSQEIAWVQSERLLVVKETPSRGIKVDLSKARVPAPSMSALSWLETSIRSYAKFVEVASKQASSGQDEAEFVRKERMALVEIRSILEEMRVDRQGS